MSGKNFAIAITAFCVLLGILFSNNELLEYGFSILVAMAIAEFLIKPFFINKK